MTGSKWVMATRVGFVARGILYLLIGWFALRSGRAEGGGDILSYLDGGLGRVLLAGMAFGFLAYGAWRLADAWVGGSGNGDDAKGLAVRAGHVVSGLIHLGLGVLAVLQATGSGGGGSSGGGNSAQQGAETAMALPGGTVLLTLAAIALVVTGLFQIKKGWKLDFLSDLERGGDWICWLGRIGYIARGIVFGLMGWLLWEAAEHQSSSQAGGLGEALGSLPSTPQYLVAAGLLIFGLYSFVEARYRRIRRPHPLR